MQKTFRNSIMACFEKPNPIMENIKYICWQEEVCPTTGRHHWQTYVEFNNSYSLKKCQNLVGVKNCHIEARKGSPIEARDYCKKSESAVANTFEEFGVIPEVRKKCQGQRNDIALIKKLVDEGKNYNEIGKEYPNFIIKFSKGIKELIQIRDYELNNKFNKPLVFVIWGNAGSGKTKMIYEKHPPSDCYKLEAVNGDALNFDNYIGQKVLIIDDFYGWIKWGQLLNLLDGYPMKLNVKYGHAWKAWDYIYITSNVPWTDWYPSKHGAREEPDGSIYRHPLLDPLKRRIDYIVEKNRKVNEPVKEPKIISDDFLNIKK